ncbi:MAG: hypothetical protein RLN60_04815 [Phycisphaerales bacterium]
MSAETKRVGLVGHCMADTARLRGFILETLGEATDVVAIRDDAQLDADASDVLLVNRILDGRFSAPNGLSLIKQIRRRDETRTAMLISNYADAQAEAERAGATPGFGKRQIGTDDAADRLRGACGASA